jgi:hypothetical protein
VDLPEDSLDVDLPVDFLETADSLVVEDSLAAIPEDSLDVDLPVDFLETEDSLATIEDIVAADLANIRRLAALGAIVEEDMEAVTVGDTAEVMLRDITMEGTTIPEDTMEGTTGTIIEDMPRMEQPLGFFSAG